MGVPNSDVIMLIGISPLIMFLAKSSDKSNSMPPTSMVAGITLTLSLPVSSRARCGTTRPTHPTIPTTLTLAAVIMVDNDITINLMSLKFTPSVTALSSSNETIFNCHLIR